MNPHVGQRGKDRARANVYVRRSRALARLTQLTRQKLVLPILKDFVLKTQLYQDKLGFMHDTAYQSSLLKQLKEFFRDREVIAAAHEFFKSHGRDKKG
jgi:hypothetical protein